MPNVLPVDGIVCIVESQIAHTIPLYCIRRAALKCLAAFDDDASGALHYYN